MVHRNEIRNFFFFNNTPFGRPEPYAVNIRHVLNVSYTKTIIIINVCRKSLKVRNAIGRIFE